MKIDFERTPDGSQRVTDANLKVTKAFAFPLYDADDNPDLGDNPNEAGYSRYAPLTGALELYNGSSWQAIQPLPSGGTTAKYLRGDSSWQTLNTSAVPEGTNLYYTSVRFSTDFAAKSTSNLAEGTNLYYTAARFNTAFAAKSTTDLAEGTNLYYTSARFNTAFAGKDTDGLSEGSTNLYFTNARVQTYSDARYLQLTAANVANGYAKLDTGGLIPLSLLPDSVLGNVKYKGTYNGTVLSSPDASLNGQPLPTAASGNAGYYFIVTTGFTLSGTTYGVGDWIISDGAAGWTKIDNSDAVTTVFGRLGNIVANTGDYTAAQVTNAVDSTASYANPGFITSLAWSKISSTPTTIAGYGITDAYTSVSHDATLTGSGTSGSNLGINLSNSNIWGALQTFPDNLFKLTNAADNTKTGVFSLAGVTTGINVVYTMPTGALAAITIASTSTVTQTFTGTTTFSGTFNVSATTGTFGSSTGAATYGLGSGATTNATTKTLNIGTAGVSGSITNINIGSAVSGSTGTLQINSPTIKVAAFIAGGLLKAAVTTGQLSIATSGTDYITPTGTESLSNKTITLSTYNGVNITTAGSGSAYLDATGNYTTPPDTNTTYTAGSGLTLTGTTFSNNLITGLVGGQTIYGDTASGGNLTISSTANVTKGYIRFGSAGSWYYNEISNRLGYGISSPNGPFEMQLTTSTTPLTATDEAFRLTGVNASVTSNTTHAPSPYIAMNGTIWNGIGGVTRGFKIQVVGQSGVNSGYYYSFSSSVVTNAVSIDGPTGLLTAIKLTATNDFTQTNGNSYSTGGFSGVVRNNTSGRFEIVVGTLPYQTNTSGTDAAYTINLTNGDNVILPAITAGRTVTFPPILDGKVFYVWNQNSSANTWTIAGSPAVKSSALAGVTTIANQTYTAYIGSTAQTAWIKLF